ncbi:MAG: 16S rRNA (adenine(1518)-N(6)/adenine(1519)-N(6))-dimethyltransferase RsmA [Aquificaceae bacterium]|nr:16S rRNA (adenine(1518)-N(6)/adenine(1519)-N(6))-dimethyltransferase RsmA [Aquificaceae bacterium]MDW8095625.1 16S rRNA (adenine(1518)-N(6)/adenine(1519)-N(6))-dimethyltransferase RsmA [Aquificaceae bacterium]
MKLKKHLGQHILVARGVITRILEFINPEDGDVLVEIGPGTGNLTLEVLKHPFKELHLIEIDKDMVLKLKERIKDERVRIHMEDAVGFDFCSLGSSLKVFGNLPYCVASLILENTVFHNACVREAVYMLQKEVAEKLQKGTSWLSTFVNTFYRLEYLMSLPARFFVPPPKVQSGLVKLSRRENPPEVDLKDYKKFLTSLYATRRKALKNKLPLDILTLLDIDPMLRVEALKPEEVFLIYNKVKKFRGEQR